MLYSAAATFHRRTTRHSSHSRQSNRREIRRGIQENAHAFHRLKNQPRLNSKSARRQVLPQRRRRLSRKEMEINSRFTSLPFVRSKNRKPPKDEDTQKKTNGSKTRCRRGPSDFPSGRKDVDVRWAGRSWSKSDRRSCSFRAARPAGSQIRLFVSSRSPAGHERSGTKIKSRKILSRVPVGLFSDAQKVFAGCRCRRV